MDAKQITGLAVVSVQEATKLGTVERIFFDPTSNEVLGFAVNTGGKGGAVKETLSALLGETSPDALAAGFVRGEHVRSLGPDALMVNDETKVMPATTGPDGGPAVTTDELSKRKVVTESGTYVGQVASVVLDPMRLRVTHYEVSPGFFKRATHVPVGLVANVGPDLIVVSDEVCRAVDQEAGAEPAGTRRFVVFEDGLENVRTDR